MGVVPLPQLRLPSSSRPAWPEAVGSLALHALVIGLALLGGRAALERARGGAASGGGVINFFPLPPASGAAAVEVPPPPRVSVTDLPALQRLAVDLPRIPMPQENLTAGAPGTGAGAAPNAGPGGGAGPGTPGAAGYILLANPRGIIVPPDCARDRYEVSFWISADGRVTDVTANPLPKDPSCRRDFMERMRGYKFTAATTRDGQPVASVYRITIRGN